MSRAIYDERLGQSQEAHAAAESMPRQPVFRHILIAADGPELRSAILRAALFVSGSGSQVSVLHVATSPIDTVLAAEPPEEPCEISAANDPVLDDVYRQIPVELRGQRIYREGNIDREILEVAREISADLLVIGTHSRGWTGRLLLGSTALHVLHHAPCPVLIAPRPVAASDSSVPESDKRILVAVDSDGEPSKAVAELASKLVAQGDARLAAIHVVPRVPEFIPEYGIMVEGALQPYLDRRGEQFLRSFPIHTPDGSAIHRMVKVGDPCDGILEAAHEWKAELIVLGVHGRTGIGRLFLGSTAERVIRHARGPVLCIPAR